MNESKKSRYGLVVKPHKSNFPDPLILSNGEMLTTSSRKSEWPGWIWCTTSEGNSGWVPEKYLTLKGDKAEVRCDYDATELDVSSGEKLEIFYEEADWAWCASSKGDKGWVPLENIQLLQE